MDDRISKLPDDILICILSRLTIEEAARASILSYRWRYLWRFFTGSLDFVDPYKIRRLAILSDPYYKCEDNYFIRVKRRNFINLVDPILGLLQTKSLQQLRICYPVNSDYDVDSWVQFAVDKRVQRLELDFSESKTEGHELHTFSPYFKTTSSFSSLVSLRLIDVDIPEEVLHYLLCYCPLLEVLTLKGAEKLIRIRVSGPSLKLKYLELRDLPNLSNLEINAPNLVSFEFSAGELIVSFKHVPSLVEMSIEGDYCTYFVYTLHQFSSFLPQLRTLKLNLMAVSVPEDFLNSIPKFPNLKHLEMTLANGDLDCYHPCVAFLKASPLLQEFTFKLSHTVEPCAYVQNNPDFKYLLSLFLNNPDFCVHLSHTVEPCAYVQNIKDHPHLNLRAVSFIGFEGREVDVEFLKDLLENAVRLEKMIIDPCKYHFMGSPGMWYYRRSEGYKCARKRAIELADKFPHVEFVPEAVLCSILELSDPKHLDFTTLLSEDCFGPCASFLKACPSLHKLTLKLPYDEFCCIPELPNLKHFELQGNIRPASFLRVAAAFVKACPSLYKLTVTVEDVTYKHRQTMKKHPHSSPRVVELIGFTWVIGEIEFLSGLLECATRLEKAIIDPMEPMFVGGVVRGMRNQAHQKK
ncbi:putative preotein [Citrus sinensis]|uniref:Preotein n=1 Tax=Citrus sinensis TaxID=2711 RepID=A0ACB8L1A9_CITSI|nr:putative preotein [Citrus sinensis]